MKGVLLFWWKNEIEDAEAHADITCTNIVRNAIWLQSGPRSTSTAVRLTQYSGLSRDAMEYLSGWAAHPTFHPRRERFNEHGYAAQWLPGLKLPLPVNPPSEQSSLPVLENSLLCRLMESSLACACLYRKALDTEVTSNCETIKDIRAALLELRYPLGEGGCLTDAAPTPATSDEQAQNSDVFENTVEAVRRSHEYD
jgi:hypothetical protein